MSTLSPPSEEPPLRSADELEALFRESETPPRDFRIGAEAEKFAVDSETLAPVPYSGPRSIVEVLERLQRRHGWTPSAESSSGPMISLSRGAASITLEPGAQLELSGAPLGDVHAIAGELRQHLEELEELSRELRLSWLSLGFHPFALADALPWVPKERYGVMKRYLPQRGRRGRDMMQRTATVQANFDYADEEDALRKLRTLLKLSPVLQALSANAPFIEGRVSHVRSERADVWRNMDPLRSGLVERLWEGEDLGYRDYIQWALDAGMFFFKRGGRMVHNTGQSFRSFLEDGFEGHRPTQSDWRWHLSTLFPESRLKSTLEVRTCDALPTDLNLAVVALLTGLLYDERALGEATELASGIDLLSARRARAEVPQRALATSLGSRSVRELAERLLQIARGGLSRRARLDEVGQDESCFLDPLDSLVGAGRCPADLLLEEGQEPGSPVSPALLETARVAGNPLQTKSRGTP